MQPRAQASDHPRRPQADRLTTIVRKRTGVRAAPKGQPEHWSIRSVFPDSADLEHRRPLALAEGSGPVLRKWTWKKQRHGPANAVIARIYDQFATENEPSDVTRMTALTERAGRHPVVPAGISLPVGFGMILFVRLTTVFRAWPFQAYIVALLLLGYLILVSALFAAGVIAWWRHRDPRPLRGPRLSRARRRRSPFEPPRQVNAIARNCVICGRRLANAKSIRARVGSTCIKRYGPRYLLVANPAHDQWTRLVAAAEALRASEQALLNAQHRSALITFHKLKEAQQRELASPSGKVRRRHRDVGRKPVLTGAFSLTFIGLAAAVSFG